MRRSGGRRVKHLNPRQGITTSSERAALHRCGHCGVKHLNPRQGITTSPNEVFVRFRRRVMCETPKSPPGDYNTCGRGGAASARRL